MCPAETRSQGLRREVVGVRRAHIHTHKQTYICMHFCVSACVCVCVCVCQREGERDGVCARVGKNKRKREGTNDRRKRWKDERTNE